MLPQLEKNQEILPSMRDEAFSCCSIMREIPPSLLSPERVLNTLEATQEVPRHPHLPSRGTLRVPPQLKKSPGLHPHPERRVSLPALSGRESRRSRRTSIGGGLHLMLERYSRGRATISKLKREGEISLTQLQQKRASSRIEGRISWFFSSCSRKLVIPLEL